MHIFSYFRNGESADMNVDGSSTAVSFRHSCAQVADNVGKKQAIERINFSLQDASIRLNRFGGIAALTNGLIIQAVDEFGSITDFTDDVPITTLGEFSNLAGIDSVAIAASGDDNWACRWTISKSGSPLYLKEGEYIEILVQDDLSDLTSFRAMAQGINV